MALPDLFILRHGETEWNREGRYQGWLDSPLTARGEDQARRMGAHLAHLGIGAATHAIRVSPAGRAQATARLAFAQAAWTTLDDLREIGMGDWSGATRADLVARGALAEGAGMLDLYATVPGGESFDGLWERAGRVLAAISGPTILVTHGITSRFLRTRALGLSLDRLAEAEGGQGVIFRLTQGRCERIEPPGEF